jgi:CheY-like chemotaxis protein
MCIAMRELLAGVAVLIVDDNDDSRDLLEAMLTYAGALTFTAEGGKDALARMRTVRIDVIVSDISMPGFSGHDFVRAVRRLPPPATETPAIAVTAFNEPGQREEALRAGFQVYLLKPVDPDELIREITRLAGRGPGSPSRPPGSP